MPAPAVSRAAAYGRSASTPRKALGRFHGRAVRFAAVDAAALVVGEGVETVLSLIAAALSGRADTRGLAAPSLPAPDPAEPPVAPYRGKQGTT